MEPLLTKYVREPNSFTLDFYLQHEGYEALKKALGDDARRGHRAGQGVRPARPRRRRFPDRHEVAVRRQEVAEAALHRLQRRRERAGHVQGSPADGAQSAPADRGVRDRLLRDRREGRLHLHPRRVLPRAARARARDRRGLRARDSSARTSSAPASTATSTCTAAPAPTRPARRRRCSNRSKASARSRATSRRFRRVVGLYGKPDRGEQRRDAVQRAARSCATAPSGSPRSGPEKNGGPKLYCVSGHVKRPGVYEASMNVTLRELIDGLRRRRARRPDAQGGDSRRVVGADSAARSARHAGELRRRSRRPARCSARPAIVVLDDTTCMVWLAENLLHFYRHESCGKCTPCREGTDWLHKILQRIERGEGQMRDLDLLVEHLGQHRRQDAVRVRRRRGHAGADDAEAFPARVRGAHQGRALHAAGRLARAQPSEHHGEARARLEDS